METHRSSMSRRTKWHPTPPPPPSPKILHFPRRRRTRRRNQKYLTLKANNLFDQERVEKRQEEEEEDECGGDKWRIPAEMLRAVERDFAFKKETVRKKIVEGESGNIAVLDELQNNSRIEPNFQQVAADSSFSDNKSIHEALTRQDQNKCSGRCKAVVVRIVEQVRAETEQWSQMQKMLEKVRGEMEELQISRDYWENRALNADRQIQPLRRAVEEWKQKALDCEKEVNELKSKLSLAKQKMHMKSKIDVRPGEGNVVIPLGAQLVKEKESHDAPPLSLAKQLAKEKRSLLLLGGVKENRRATILQFQERDSSSSSKQELMMMREDRRSRRYSSIYGAAASNRCPLMEISNGNSSPLAHRAAFDYHSPERSRIRESFRKS